MSGKPVTGFLTNRIWHIWCHLCVIILCYVRFHLASRLTLGTLLAGLLKPSGHVGKAHMTVKSSCPLGAEGSLQLTARKSQGLQSYRCKEVNLPVSRGSVGTDSFPVELQMRMQPGQHLAGKCEPLSREPQVSGHLTHRNWGNKSVLF